MYKNILSVCVGMCLFAGAHIAWASDTILLQDDFNRPDSASLGNGWVEEGELLATTTISGFQHYPSFVELTQEAVGFHYVRKEPSNPAYAGRPYVYKKFNKVFNDGNISFELKPSNFGRVNFEVGLMNAENGFVKVFSTGGEADNPFELISIPKNGIGVSLRRSDGNTQNSAVSFVSYNNGVQTVILKELLGFQFLNSNTYVVNMRSKVDGTITLSIMFENNKVYEKIFPFSQQELHGFLLDQFFITDTQMGILIGADDTTFFDSILVTTSDTYSTTPATSTPPTIALIGDGTVRVFVGEQYDDEGATASDSKDGDLTSSIVRTGTVDTSITGTTTLVFSVTNTSGLSASTTRTIIVRPTGVYDTGGITPPQGTTTATTTPPVATSTPQTASTTTSFATSSIAFFPGITGSRLFRLEGMSEYFLWESLFSNDLAYLGFTEAGVSMHDDIFVGSILDRVHSVTGFWDYGEVYEGWIQFLDALKARQVIHNWTPISYDWRLATDDVVTHGKSTADGLSYLGGETDFTQITASIVSLAQTSPSGKVTLVGHSNGGLVIKNLLAHLEQSDPYHILSKIDTILLVASPQLGTPETIGDLLHGTAPLSSSFREVTKNMPGVYGLLPSQKLFERITDPVAVFDQSVSRLPSYAHRAGTSIVQYSDLKNFLLGDSGKREGGGTNLNTPLVLQEGIFRHAETIHSSLDGWRAPQTIRFVELVGDGLPTVRGVHYFADELFGTLAHEWLFSLRGDGTVLTASAEGGSASETYFAYLDTFNTLHDTNYKHGTILSTEPVQSFVERLMRGSNTLTSSYILPNKATLLSRKRFEVRVYSPVDIHLFSASGKHTGVLSEVSGGDVGRAYEEQVPNSYYKEWGEEKYMGADLENGEMIHLSGTGNGTFTLALDTFTGDTKTDSFVFTHIPVTEHASGTIALRVGEAPILFYDIDGNGSLDAVLHAGDVFVWNPQGGKVGGGAILSNTSSVKQGGGATGGSLLTQNTDTLAPKGSVLGTSTFLFLRNLHKGAVGSDVRELQERLRAEGFFTFATSTNYFGPRTLEAVLAYQKAHQTIGFLTGFVGERTRAVLHGIPQERPNTLFLENLREGMRGDGVYTLQALLRKAGFFTYASDTGYFGSITKQSVQAFQKAHGLPETGFVGMQTRDVLKNIVVY